MLANDIAVLVRRTAAASGVPDRVADPTMAERVAAAMTPAGEHDKTARARAELSPVPGIGDEVMEPRGMLGEYPSAGYPDALTGRDYGGGPSAKESPASAEPNAMSAVAHQLTSTAGPT
ncbi:MAG: hypothetical protein ACRDWD_04090 [Acidimicrobiia bacterium]